MSDNDKALEDLITGVQQWPILQANEPNELMKAVKDSLIDSLESFQRRWKQCDLMEKTVADDDNSAYDNLRNKISNLQGNEWFYIGYTKQPLGQQFYLWNKQPKSKKFNAAKANNNLVKSHTYYTTLQGVQDSSKSKDGDESDAESVESQESDVSEENEHALIQAFYKNQRCLNASRNGKKEAYGIVYVLVYESPDNQGNN